MNTKKQIDEIKEKFNKVIKYSQEISGNVNTDQLFDDWYSNKSAYIKAWDGELIKELGEMEFHLSEEQRAHAVSNVIDNIAHLYSQSGLRYPDFKFDDLANFIFENQDTFFDNIVSVNWQMDEISIPKGMKLLKAFKYFCEDKDLLNDIQSVASMAIQNDKVSGILCMSVHPLDFLSVSENDHNWRSCHALDGEYRAGNLNYMADKTTVICYLKSTHKHILPNFPPSIKWNSKKWRMLLFFDEEKHFMMAGRQYPYFENSLLLPIKHEVERMFNIDFSGWMNHYYTMDTLKPIIDDEHADPLYKVSFNERYLPVGSRIMRMGNLVKDVKGTLQFDDLLQSSTYQEPYYSFALTKGGWGQEPLQLQYWSSSVPKIRVGQPCKCVECNKKLITMSESFLCNSCMIKEGTASTSYDEFDDCPLCGQIFDVEEGSLIINQDGYEVLVCPDCAKEAVKCKNCGILYAKHLGLCPICMKSKKNTNFEVETIEKVNVYNAETEELLFSLDDVVMPLQPIRVEHGIV